MDTLSGWAATTGFSGLRSTGGSSRTTWSRRKTRKGPGRGHVEKGRVGGFERSLISDALAKYSLIGPNFRSAMGAAHKKETCS